MSSSREFFYINRDGKIADACLASLERMGIKTFLKKEEAESHLSKVRADVEKFNEKHKNSGEELDAPADYVLYSALIDNNDSSI